MLDSKRRQRQKIKLPLTRAIKVSRLSRFLQRGSWYQDSSGMQAVPALCFAQGARPARNINPATMTILCIRDKSYRDTALCHKDSSETP